MAKKRQASLDEVADQAHSAAIHLLRAARDVDHETGLSAARLSALSVVVFAGPVSLQRLAAAEQVTAPTMSRLVQGLEADGLVRKRLDPDDARAVRIEATAKGRRTLDEGRRRRIGRIVSLLEHLSAKDLATLRRAARIIETSVARAKMDRADS